MFFFFQVIRVNDQYIAVRTQNAICIHNLQGSLIIQVCGGDTGKHASCFVLTQNFLIYGTLEGDLCFMHLETMQVLSAIGIKHKSPIVEISSNENGTTAVFVDGDKKGFVYDTFSHDIIPIPAFPSCEEIIWDQSYNNTFHVYDGKEIHSFIVNLTSIRGAHVTKFGSVCIADDGKISIISQSCTVGDDIIPIACQKGEIISQSTKDCKIINIALSTFSDFNGDISPSAEIQASFSKYIVLNYLEDAWKCACEAKSESMFRALGNKAMETMNVSIALRAFQELGEVAIVQNLEEIQYIEEKNLLCGHLAILFGDHDLAEGKFLNSSVPSKAFEMRSNFGQFKEALSLATEYFPKEIINASILLANELEVAGDYRSSLEVLEQALETNPREKDDSHCLSMIAKTSLRLGNKSRALSIAQKLSWPTLYCDLAELFEAQGDKQSAAKLFELGNKITDSIRLWMSEKNLERVSTLLQTHANEVTMTTAFYNEYAFLCESMEQFDLAVQAYKSANNIQDAVRLCLTTMQNSKEAIEIVRLNPIESVAFGAAEICKSTTEDYKSAVEFLVLGKYYNEAFELAAMHGYVDFLVSLTKDTTNPTLLENIGSHYESKGDAILGAKFYCRSPQSAEKGMQILIQNNLVLEAIELSKGNNDLAKKLVILLEENNDKSLEMKIHFHHLYLETNQWSKALQITNPIIEESMISLGDYIIAHDIACKTIMKLDPLRVGLGSNLRSLFNVLHSYYLAKKFVKCGNHKSAAPLLLRVAENIKMFAPKDHLNILISTVIECSKCGLHVSNLATFFIELVYSIQKDSIPCPDSNQLLNTQRSYAQTNS